MTHWLGVLGETLIKGAIGDIDGAVKTLFENDDAAKEAKTVEAESVRVTDTVPAPAPEVIDLVASTDGTFVRQISDEGCGKTFNKGSLVCVEHDEHGDCVLKRLR